MEMAMPREPPVVLESELESTRLTEEKIMAALEDESINRIGICGSVGIGKTSIGSRIGETVEREKLFEVVGMVRVGPRPNLSKIRYEISDCLNIRSEGGESAARGRVLIILDDVQGVLDLEEIGIRQQQQRPSKLIITSRFKEVCMAMGCLAIYILPGTEKEKMETQEHVGKNLNRAIAVAAATLVATAIFSRAMAAGTTAAAFWTITIVTVWISVTAQPLRARAGEDKRRILVLTIGAAVATAFLPPVVTFLGLSMVMVIMQLLWSGEDQRRPGAGSSHEVEVPGPLPSGASKGRPQSRGQKRSQTSPVAAGRGSKDTILASESSSKNDRELDARVNAFITKFNESMENARLRRPLDLGGGDAHTQSFGSTSNQNTMTEEAVASFPRANQNTMTEVAIASFPRASTLQIEEINDEAISEVSADMVLHDEGYLEDCILFCSVFPSDYEFTKDILVWQWIAGGVINLEEDEIMEEACIECFDRLLSMDYIVASRYDHFVDQMKYKIGEKMTAFLQKQLLEPKFQKYLDGRQGEMAKVEHLSLAFEEIDGMNFGVLKRYSHLQSLIIHRCYGSKENHLPSDLFLELKVLKILNLSCTNIVELPSSVENLKELRYLDMSETPIVWLPETIRHFSSLQTLKLDGCLSLRGLPKCTNKLINLRHLVLDVARQLQSMPNGIGKLSKLLTLSAFLVGEDDGCRIGELKDMNKLRGSLRILNLENVETKEAAAEACLCNKQGLRKIELQWSDLQDEKNPYEEEIVESLRPPFGIQELKILFYSGGVLPSWICNPSFRELDRIVLYKCRYCCSLPSLGELPSLKHLSIIGNEEVTEINSIFCREQTNPHHVAFPKLEKLSFDSMSKLEKWTGLENGDFPSLRRLIIEDCPKFVGLPSLSLLDSLLHMEISYCPELWCLPVDGLPSKLESLMIKDCPKLKDRCCNEQCEDWSKVAPVPLFYIDNRKVSP